MSLATGNVNIKKKITKKVKVPDDGKTERRKS